MSGCFPDEVYMEILSWLPVKAVIRFRCVSKTWGSLISSSHFIALHLNRSLSIPQHPPYLLRREFNYRLEMARLNILSVEEPFSWDNFIELPSLDENIDKFKIVAGSSNGLLCLANDVFSPNYGSYLLWNPSIQKAIAIPNPDVGMKAHCPFTTSLGFGYIPKTDDYKLVRIVDRDHTLDWTYDIVPHWVQIYSLRTRAWHTIMVPGPPYHIKKGISAAFLHNSLHWLASVRQHPYAPSNVIVSFDLEDEVFREVGVPKSLQAVRYRGVAVVNDMLAFIPSHSMLEESKYLWVMKEYRVVESWTKLLDINDRNGRKSISYIPSSHGTLNFPFGLAGWFFVDKYLESLVLLNVEK